MDQGPIRPLPQTGTQAGGGFSPTRHVVRGPVHGVFKRVVLLCIRPESWADMARYPLRYTFWTVLVAVILASALTAIAMGRTFTAALAQIAASYDSQFAALTLEKGKLSAPAGTPVNRLPQYDIGEGKIVIDPTGQTHINDLPEFSILIGADSMHTKSFGRTASYPDIFKEAEKEGLSGQLNGTTLKQFVAANGGELGAILAVFAFGFFLATHTLWALIIAFLVSPLVRIAAPNLRMPRGMAYRVSGSITVPLLMLSAALELLGHPPRVALGTEIAALFWFFTAAALALWGGYLLNCHAIEALKRTRGH